MKLTVLGSGSKGNCYLLHDEARCLILEAGVPFKQVLRALGGNIRKISGCLVTHEHGDHAKYVADFVEHGIKVYMTAGTKIQLLGNMKEGIKKTMMRHGINVLGLNMIGNAYESREVVSFMVQPFATVHDAAEPCGFFINAMDTGNIVFATDTSYIPNTFKDVTNMLIECNYDEELLAAREDIPESLKQRIRDSHQSIDTCIAAINANRDQPTLHQVILLHLSEGDGGDPEQVRQRVMQGTGMLAYVAQRGTEFDIKEYPF